MQGGRSAFRLAQLDAVDSLVNFLEFQAVQIGKNHTSKNEHWNIEATSKQVEGDQDTLSTVPAVSTPYHHQQT